MAGEPAPVRIRAVAVVVDGGDVLLIDRQNAGRAYSALPGGGVEQGETLEAACLRELREETALDGIVDRLLPVPLDLAAPAVYFAVAVGSRELRLGEPEASRSSDTNGYLPRWCPLGDLAERDILPEARLAIVLAGERS